MRPASSWRKRRPPPGPRTRRRTRPRSSRRTRPGVGSDFALEPETTSVGAFAQVAADLGEAFGAGGPDRQHFGFAEQVVDSVYLGTSTGLRLRHVQPTAGWR